MTRKNRNNRNHASKSATATDLTKMAEIKAVIPADGSAVELPLPKELCAFFSEDGKLMIKKNDHHKVANFGITYEEIAKHLFIGKEVYFTDGNDVKSVSCTSQELANQGDNARSSNQVRKQLAYNKLLNIASYLNGDSNPRYADPYSVHYIIAIGNDGKPEAIKAWGYAIGIPLFPDKYTCEQAIRIMGKESLHDLLNLCY